MRRIFVRYGLPDCQPQVRQERQAGGREDPPYMATSAKADANIFVHSTHRWPYEVYHQLRPEGRSRERPDHGAGASRPEPDQSAGSPRRPCFGARVLGAAARTTPPRPCQRQTCRRRAAAHPDRLPDRAGQAAKADLRCAEQDHHLRGIFCIAHAGTRHRREGEPRPVELLPTRSDKVHHFPATICLNIRL